MMSMFPVRIGLLGAATIVPMALTDPARSVPVAKVVAIGGRRGNVPALQLRACGKASGGEMKLGTDAADAIGNTRLIDAIHEKAGLKQKGKLNEPWWVNPATSGSRAGPGLSGPWPAVKSCGH